MAFGTSVHAVVEQRRC